MGLNIKKAIYARGLEVGDVAEKMGITPQSMSKHINGNPTVAILERIAKVLDCDVVELFEEPTERKLSPVQQQQLPEPPKDQAYICPKCGTKFQVFD